MKTQTIATLADYFHRIGKKVLVVAPGTKARDELIKRCKTAFNLDVPNSDLSVNAIITSGLLNRKDIKDPVELAKLEKLWRSYEVVLCDEVEYTVNDSGDFLYSRLTGADCLYGFSGTADKEAAELITFVNGLDDVVMRNRNLIKYFGPSLVYRLPLKMDIDLIKVMTPAIDSVKIDTSQFDANTNMYLAVMTTLLTDPGICNVMCKLIEKYPMTYIPINNLNNIIYHWIDNYFVGRFRVLLICGEGYIYYDLKGNRTVLKDLQEAWDYVDQGLVDVIPSTSSGYRALDLPKLENMICLQGKLAGVVLQSIGRIARGKHMNVLTLSGMTKRRIPVYAKGCEERDELIKNYYKYCNIVESEIQEINL